MKKIFLKIDSPLLIAADHGGYDIKQILQKKFDKLSFQDLGTHDHEVSVDYPDFAGALCRQLLNKLSTNDQENPNAMGVLVCGSGQGMSMAANKFKGIRAALCWSSDSAKLARQHNNANVLCLGARLLSTEDIFSIVETFFTTQFEGGRHLNRINKIEH